MPYLKRGLFKGVPSIKCLNCSYEGKSKRISKGSTGIEIILWLFFILPGLIYSFWRSKESGYGCPKCRSDNVITE